MKSSIHINFSGFYRTIIGFRSFCWILEGLKPSNQILGHSRGLIKVIYTSEFFYNTPEILYIFPQAPLQTSEVSIKSLTIFEVSTRFRKFSGNPLKIKFGNWINLSFVQDYGNFKWNLRKLLLVLFKGRNTIWKQAGFSAFFLGPLPRIPFSRNKSRDFIKALEKL